MRTARRIVALMAALIVLAIGTAVPANAGPESTFLSRINASRAAAGLPPLLTNDDLVDDARAWSQRMLEAGAISHNPNLGSVASGWESLGENVGVGPDEGTLHDAFMASAGHRQNILGDYTHIGVGVVVESDVRMWVTVVFMKAAGAPAPTTTTTSAPPVAATAVSLPQETVNQRPSVPTAVKAAIPIVLGVGRSSGLLPFAI